MSRDIDWLRELHAELWPPQPEKGWRSWVQIKLEAKRRLKKREWQRVCRAIAKSKLIVEMNSTNMFGGVGIWLYEHPHYPGLPVEHIFTLTQDHLPGRKKPEATLGSCLSEAWEIFSKLSDTDKNREWLKRYGLKEPRDASYYDY